MNKKILYLTLLFVLTLGLNSCSKDDESSNANESEQTETTVNYKTFNKQRIAFTDAYGQTAVENFNLPENTENVKTIKMFLQLDCPTQGCNIWDMYANIQAKDKATGEWYEIARYITPYGRSTSVLERGFEVDVTDFKSVLKGNTELRAFIEVWGADGWLVSVDFDYTFGTPDFKYYEVAPILQYNKNSLEGVPYGEAHNFDLTKTIKIPSNSESTHIRTIISGWGHATPLENGRGCAEWCFRKHYVFIDNAQKFEHNLKAENCSANPIKNQQGNWQGNRAGWCPGAMVPVRIDYFTNNVSGTDLNFEYKFTEWTNNLQAAADNPHAYYALSNFVIVKSNTPISKPQILE